MVSPCPSAPGSPSWGCSPSQQRRTRNAAGSAGFPERSQSPFSLSPAPAAPECPSRILTGSYEEAGARLQEALRPTPPSEAARARRGLLSLKKGDVPAAARDLQCLAETDAGDLGFLLRLLEASERQSLAQVGAAPHGAPTPAAPQHRGRGVGGGRAGGTQVWPPRAQGDSVIGTRSSGGAAELGISEERPRGVSSKEGAGRGWFRVRAGRAWRPLPGDETRPEGDRKWSASRRRGARLGQVEPAVSAPQPGGELGSPAPGRPARSARCRRGGNTEPTTRPRRCGAGSRPQPRGPAGHAGAMGAVSPSQRRGSAGQ